MITQWVAVLVALVIVIVVLAASGALGTVLGAVGDFLVAFCPDNGPYEGLWPWC